MALDQLDSLAVVVLRRMAGKRAVKSVEDRQQILHQAADAAAGFVLALALDTLAIVIEIGLAPDQRAGQFFLLGYQTRDILDRNGLPGGSFARRRRFTGRFSWTVGSYFDRNALLVVVLSRFARVISAHCG
jgi:hypothetical protein